VPSPATVTCQRYCSSVTADATLGYFSSMNLPFLNWTRT
jgi:hypothetical protein